MSDLLSKEMMEIQYVSSGRFITANEWIHSKRIIDSYEIIYVVEGCIFIQEDEERFCVDEGGIILLHPFRTHFGYQKSTGKTSFYWVHYTDPDMYTYHNIKQHICLQDIYHINLLLKQMLHFANTPGYPQYAMSLLIWLILTEIAAKQDAQLGICSPLLKNIREWIRINADRKLTVRNVADAFGYSEDYIARLFKKSFSIGIKEYINEMKMNVVKNKLLTGSCTIKQIANETGFDDYKNFLKFFKYHEDMSPLEFRNTYFNTHLNKI